MGEAGSRPAGSELANLTAVITELIKVKDSYAGASGREDSKQRWPNSMLNRKSLIVDAVRTIENMNSQSIMQTETLLSQGLNPPETPSGGGVSMPLVPETLAQRFDPSEAPSGGVVSQPLVSEEALKFQGLNPPGTPLVVSLVSLD